MFASRVSRLKAFADSLKDSKELPGLSTRTRHIVTDIIYAWTGEFNCRMLDVIHPVREDVRRSHGDERVTARSTLCLMLSMRRITLGLQRNTFATAGIQILSRPSLP